jgi:hypothetical protein
LYDSISTFNAVPVPGWRVGACQKGDLADDYHEMKMGPMGMKGKMMHCYGCGGMVKEMKMK